RPVAPSQRAAKQAGYATPHSRSAHPRPINTKPAALKHRPAKKKKRLSGWLLLLPVGLVGMFGIVVIAGLLLFQMSFANTILPRVSAGGVALGGMTETEATNALNAAWNTILLSDGEATWSVNPSTIGITLDASATAERAFAQGHGEGGLTAFFNDVDITPVLSVNSATMNTELANLASTIETPARNAGVAFVDGEVQATPPEDGTMIDIQATISALQADASILADGVLELTMLPVSPAVTDASALVAEAESLLGSPIEIRVFDPVTGDSVYWSAQPDVWANWLTATSDPSSAIGLSLSADADSVRSYLTTQATNSFDSTRTLDFDTASASVQSAIEAGTPNSAIVTVKHTDRTHTVQSGETITSIAWDYGIPYLYIVQANGGVESVSVGQQLTIPPADMFLEGNNNPDKRIIVSISEQRTYVYENGELIYNWLSSTGISDSPTWTGIYQIQSRELNAYAGNWNLYMPNFMAVYQPVPGAGFTNGFHGFPTRGGGQLLWENSLGTRVTYGCILLSNTNIAILYEWAEDGVIVEIRP
ncbi:MAG: L,D-transpeptidase family protein, partial [Chloroflexota bacterium]